MRGKLTKHDVNRDPSCKHQHTISAEEIRNYIIFIPYVRIAGVEALTELSPHKEFSYLKGER